jgi:hypothetical protein
LNPTFAALTKFVPLTFDEANERLELDAIHPDWHVADVFGRVPEEVFVYEGSVEAPRDVRLVAIGEPAGLYVIEGDLTVKGTLEFTQDDGGGVLYVTGNVRAKNLALLNQAHLWTGKDLEVSGLVLDSLSDGGALLVRGHTAAKAILEANRPSGRALAQPSSAKIFRRSALRRELQGQNAEDLAEALRRGDALLAS